SSTRASRATPRKTPQRARDSGVSRGAARAGLGGATGIETRAHGGERARVERVAAHAAAAERRAKAEVVGTERRERRDVAEPERAGETGEQAERAGAPHEIAELDVAS